MVAGDAVVPREDVPAAELIVGEDAVLVGREPAPRVLVSQSALQGQTMVGPLILRVQPVVPRAVAQFVRGIAHRELDRDAVAERVAQLIVGVLELVVHLVRGVVPEARHTLCC